MELLKEIVHKLETKVFPALQFIDRPINFPIDKDSKISLMKTGVCITSHLWTDEHLDITSVKTGSLISHFILFEGKHLHIINNGLDKFISSVINDITSPESRKNSLSKEIIRLSMELQEIERE